MMQPLICQLSKINGKELSEPEIVAIFDADFSAREVFLQRADQTLQFVKLEACELKSLAGLIPAGTSPSPLIRPRFGRGN